MKAGRFLIAVLMLAMVAPAGADTPRGQMQGGVAYSFPAWFKASFLNFPEDVEEARKQGKHLMLFFHLEECPYCARMLKENFTDGERRDYIQKHFDVVAVNIRGDLETVWVDGKTFPERALAGHIKVVATPTVVLLGQDGNKVLQFTGYRDPAALRLGLEFVQSKSYTRQTFAEYLAVHPRPAAYTLRDHPQFVTMANFKGFQKPLAILFEDKQCAECARFHEKTLNHPDVLAEMKKFTVVRFDADSTQSIVDLNGDPTTPAQWVKSLGLTYRPSVVLFNEGHPIFRIDSRLYHFHFKETLRYVSGGHYKQYDSISKYNAARRAELLGKGIDINYAE